MAFAEGDGHYRNRIPIVNENTKTARLLPRSTSSYNNGLIVIKQKDVLIGSEHWQTPTELA
jgi:hypothetical protein